MTKSLQERLKEIEDFVNAAEKNRSPLANGKDGLMALKIAEAATKSFKEGREVKII